MSLSSLLISFNSNSSIRNNITAWKTFPNRSAKVVSIPEEFHPSLIFGLNKSGFSKLYSHQRKSWDLIKNQENIAIVTGTASGKSLCYNLPVIDNLLKNEDLRALYLFPTKALAQDQLVALNHLLHNITGFSIIDREFKNRIKAATFDGDTPQHERRLIRSSSHIIITNPDMLHQTILPNHTQWKTFFCGLRFVVIDEIHTYRGVFGSHVANVIRRLKRIAKFYGTHPQFILTSATIGNPDLHANQLTEEPIRIITEDGSPQGEKHFLIYNPPIINQELGIRAGLLPECVKLANYLFGHKAQTIIFGRTRRTIEILLNLLRDEFTFSNDEGKKRIRAYRSGYLPEHRREIETGLRYGEIKIVVATNALELGIDIGQLRAVILAGFPGTIAGTWQQAGRAGRGQETSLVILVTSSRPIDQYIAQHPDFIFEQHPEHARINPDNLLILLEHLKCATFELPFCENESFGLVLDNEKNDLLEFLKSVEQLYYSRKRYYWNAGYNPASSISLRNTSVKRYILQIEENNHTITLGEVDEDSAYWMVHPQAIYLHEGKSYLVKELNIENRTVSLQPLVTDYYTKPQQKVELTVINVKKETHVSGGAIAYGDITVKEQVTGFTRVLWENNQKLDFTELLLPPLDLLTQGYLFKINESTVTLLRETGKWNNDPNDYGPNWTKQRELARKRDEFSCQVCGIAEYNQQHHVHHKNPFKLFSSYLEANSLDNLITLCPSCHHRVETQVYIRSSLTGLSHLIGNLAPLYVMCDPNDIGIFNEPKSSLNNGNPLIVLYDRISGGMGFSQRLYEIHYDLMDHSHKLVTNCECKEGCPSCVGPGGEFGAGCKMETIELLEILVENS